MKIRIACLAVLFACCGLAHAAAGEPLDLQSRYGRYHTTITLAENGTAVETYEWSRTILKEAAVRWSKRASVTYSTSVQKAEVLAAYTQKPDGRRIDVPKDNYQLEVNGGKEKDAPVFSDLTTLTVVFPDVSVGDTLVFSYRTTQTEPLFPRQFATTETFSKQSAFDDVSVKIDYPASMWVQYEARGMTQKEGTSIQGRKSVEWTYSNPQPVKSERRDYSVFDPEKETGYSFSTFKSYAEIVDAYGARALPKAAVTERIQKLSDEIVTDKQGAREHARALYEWVAKNITYAGNCIGLGTVVPHDLPFVLDNKMGDCKDHATLLQALLTARGIKSTQALINAGSVYRLPRIPVVSTVNHVINYLPELDLYVDSTVDYIPFGMLPFGDTDKPVLLVEGFRDGTRTPPQPASANLQRMKSVLKIAADGSISGTVDVHERGQHAVESRASARKMTKEAQEDLVKNMFRSMGAIGSGKFDKDDPTELTDSYHYKADIKMEHFTKLPGSGAFYINPVFSTAAPISNFAVSAQEPELEADIACSGGASNEEYVIELPKTMKVLSVPDNLKLSNTFLSYSASYRLKGNTLTVKRALDDRTKGSVCPPSMSIEYKKFAEKVLDNLRTPVLYK